MPTNYSLHVDLEDVPSLSCIVYIFDVVRETISVADQDLINLSNILKKVLCYSVVHIFIKL